MRGRLALMGFLFLLAGSVMAESPDSPGLPPGMRLPPGHESKGPVVAGVCRLASASLPFGSLDEVPETGSLDGCQLRIKAHPWINAEPPVPAGGRGLDCKVTLTVQGIHPSATAGDFKLERLWAFNEDAVWETAFTNESRPEGGAFKTEAVARCGPQWSGSVSVVVKVRHAETGEETFLKAPEERITIAQ